jgi:SAM-dependent methyltransferase
VPYSPTELEAFVRQRAPQIAKEIRDAACKACNEADLVAAVERIIEKFATNFDVTLHLDRERTLINGRADAVYNRFVIEYEPPNSLRKELSARPNQHAIGQVKQYMEGLERLDRQKKERMAGAVLDGSFFIFIRYRDDRWHVDDPVPVAAHSTETFLRYLLSLSTELAVTPENLVRDFGENSNTARAVVPALYRALGQTFEVSKTSKVSTLFRQWRRQFQEVTGYDASGGQLDAAALAKSYAVKDAQPDLERLFFAIHTYYATFIKLLALQVAHYYLMPKVGSGLGAAANYPSDKLRGYLARMERGGLFAELGIRNFLEGDFFGWYLDAWDEGLDAALRRLIGDLANYSLVTLDVDPEETRDLLKRLYQNLMPKKLRHALGEYYTPDWLAERLLNQLGYDGDPKKRLLDPACGSGTFLVLAIKRVRCYADDRMLPPAQVLDQVLGNIVGFDLNPLAVISARTNYLLALGDLLEQRKGEITIPVYLADSILTPSQGADLLTQHGFSFNTAVGKFSVPRSLVDARYIDPLADLLEECVTSKLTADQFRARLLHSFPPDASADETEVKVAVALYEQLADLERQGINGIWARIIKNAFAPLFQGRFDFVAGNPPWVNWESLPGDYRNETKPLWVYHNLFPHRGMDTILGKGKKDISMLLTFVAADNYLKDDGKLGFIITQSVLKTAGAGQGFRRFTLGSGQPIAVLSVDDLVDLQPFEGATNRTAVISVQRGRKTRYPVSYNVWRKTAPGRVAEDLSLTEATAMCKIRQFVAQPVDDSDPTSPWLTGKRGALQAVQKVLGASDYTGKAGVCTWLNGVYWLEVVAQRPDGLVVVSNITEGAKREVENVQAAIEPDLLYPLLRGRDVNRWQATPQAHLLMVQDPKKRRGYDEDWLAVTYPKAYAYLKRFEEPLRQRSGYRRYFDSSDPFYSLFDVGDYTFAPYKIVWRGEVATSLVAAVVSEHEARRVVPDQTSYFVPSDSRLEAHYLCALLNSLPIRAHYKMRDYKHVSMTFISALDVPKFTAENTTSALLADLSQQAHAATAAGDTARVREIEAEVDRLAARLWGLTDAELREIQESLAELG